MTSQQRMRVMLSAIAACTLVMMVVMYINLGENDATSGGNIDHLRLHGIQNSGLVDEIRRHEDIYRRDSHLQQLPDFDIELHNIKKIIPDDPILDAAVRKPHQYRAEVRQANNKFENPGGYHQELDREFQKLAQHIEQLDNKSLAADLEHHHGEEDHFHHWHVERPLSAVENERTVAVGLALTTRGQPDLTADRAPSELPFFRRMLLSFCHTCTYGYEYHFYVAHDHNDPYFQFIRAHKMFELYFSEFVKRNCPHGMNVTLHLVECGHSGHPAWAQNDAMMDAYMDNMAYFYRINDDTVMETTGWTERLIEQLLRNSPPNVGVAGPWFKDGNTAILTHDFVHRVHIDIFGSYYPRVFTDWFADDWITGVYWPDRAHKVHGVSIKHTMELGSRYVAHYEKAQQVALEVEIGRAVLRRWVFGREAGVTSPLNSTSVVAIALHGGSHDATFGVLRYAQMVPVTMAGWRVRVYMENPANDTTYLPVPNYMMRKLDIMGIETVFVNASISKLFPPDMWPLLIADDPAVKKFLVRDARMRPSEREWSAIKAWLYSGKSFHCIRDHPRHATKAVTPTLIGGLSVALRDNVGKPWMVLMQGFKSDVQFMNKVIWPLVMDNSLCHDSVSCKNWTASEEYPELRNDNDFVGRFHDENDQPEHCDTRAWDQKYSSPDCVRLQQTGFQEEAVRTVVRMRPVIWSQDYHVTPVMDMKSLLGPVGVKVIDKSLSYYCEKVGTCAQNLRVITRENGMRLTPMQMEQFYRSYVNDPEMKQVTAYVCALPVAMCEAFLKFNRSIIVWATIRYEQARPEKEKWQQLNNDLLSIAEHPRSVLAANNMYDLKYMEYFLGKTPILLPNYCAYLRDSYKPSRKQFLASPIHSTELSEKFYRDFDDELLKRMADIVLVPLRQMYPQYLFSDLAAHPAVVYVPYQVSMVSLTEQYRMNIPLFFPHIDLLTDWQLEYQVVRHRTWAGYMHKRPHGSAIPGKYPNVPDPNDDTDAVAIKYWFQFADFYQWPHIIYYKSMSDLVEKLISTNLTQVSLNMEAHNVNARQQIKDTWSSVLLKITGTV